MYNVLKYDYYQYMKTNSYERAVIRQAFLDAQSTWLAEANEENQTPVGRTIALVIADAMMNEAKKWKDSNGVHLQSSTATELSTSSGNDSSGNSGAISIQ